MRVIGGSNLIAITGVFGSGKSLLLIEFALAMAENYKKTIILNFHVEKKDIYAYCKRKKYQWLVSQMEAYDADPTANTDPIEFIDLSVGVSDGGTANNTALDKLFKDSNGETRKRCVVCVDEMGIFLNARNWQKVSSNFQRYLVQVRRMRIHLIVAFQFLDQVDKQFRLLVQHWIVCKSLTSYSKHLDGPKIHARFIYHYNAAKFRKLEGSNTVKAAFVRPWLWAKEVQWHILPIKRLCSEVKQVFKIYEFFLNRPSKYSINSMTNCWIDEDLLFKCFDSFEVVEGGVVSECNTERITTVTANDSAHNSQNEMSENNILLASDNNHNGSITSNPGLLELGNFLDVDL